MNRLVRIHMSGRHDLLHAFDDLRVVGREILRLTGIAVEVVKFEPGATRVPDGLPLAQNIDDIGSFPRCRWRSGLLGGGRSGERQQGDGGKA